MLCGSSFQREISLLIWVFMVTAGYENSNFIGEIRSGKVRARPTEALPLPDRRNTSAKLDRRTVAACPRWWMGCVFQLVGFCTFPKAPPQPVESSLELHTFGCCHGFDFGEDGQSKVVFDNQAILFADDGCNTDHCLKLLARTRQIRLVSVGQPQLSSFRNGPNIRQPLWPGV